MSEVLLDGSPDLTLLGALAYSPTQDSVRQVSIRPFDTDASFGHTIGGVINQVTKSGTNAFHGTVVLVQPDLRTWMRIRTSTAVEPANQDATFHYNQYGLTFGGPVWIPHVFNGKDKLFFFFAYEGLKDSTPASTFTTVPTTAERNGDFSQLLAAGCTAGYTVNSSTARRSATARRPRRPDPYQLYNPFTATQSGTTITRTAIPNNNLASTGHGMDPVAAAYLKLIPQANTTGSATGQVNYLQQRSERRPLQQ